MKIKVTDTDLKVREIDLTEAVKVTINGFSVRKEGLLSPFD